MSTVMIKCPCTGRPVSTGIEIEPATFDRMPNVNSSMRCALCGGDHVRSMREAWLAGGTADYRKVQS